MRALGLEELHARLRGRGPDGRVDLTGVLLERLDLRGIVLEDVDLGRRDGEASILRDVQLQGAVLRRCGLAGVRLEGVRLQDAHLDGCDLRYADLERTSLKQATLLDCDLYRSRLGPGTVFEGADVSRCSLYLADLDGVVLPRSAIDEGTSRWLLQERRGDFAAYHARLTELGRGDGRTTLHLARRRSEAATVYRALAGHWASRGATRDASWAYVRAKRLETAALNPVRVLARRRAERAAGLRPAAPGPLRALGRYLGGLLAWLVAGYGERPVRVLVAAAAWLVLMGTVFWLRDTAGGDVLDAYLLALQAVSATPPDLELGRLDRALVSLVTVGGVTLLGLLGFTLGNRLRNA